ncbi:11717_t:CDS:2, partial [Dentiscutata erythropus]
MEGISTLENCFDTNWISSSNEAVKIRFVQPLSESDNEHDETKVLEFSPEFTYPIFGDKEQIFGYKNLSIKLYYASSSLTTYFDVTYDKKSPLADNVVERIKEFIPYDPSDRFQEIRDKNDIRFLREDKALEGLKAPVDKNVFNELQKKYKLNKRQMARCVEIELLRNLNKTDPVAYKAYRLQVKQRLYLWNEDILRQLDRAERILKLEETFKGLEEDYHSIILQ